MKNQKGFTLIELLVVIAIIGLLSTLAVVSLNGARTKARDARRMSDIRSIQSAVELFKNNSNTDVAPSIDATPIWSELSTSLAGQLAGGAPTDPNNVAPYTYIFCSANNSAPAANSPKTAYLIGGNLEGTTAVQGGLTGAATAGTYGAYGTACLRSDGVAVAQFPTCNPTTAGTGLLGSGSAISFCLGQL